MAGLKRNHPVHWRGLVRFVTALAWAGGVYAPGLAQTTSSQAWEAASAARKVFEAQPSAAHTRAAFAAAMNPFRAIYHANPADLDAPRAVQAVAELLAEQGRELKDRKSLRDAAGQYEFLASAYPQSSLVAPGLGKALDLLGPDAANDVEEAAKVRALLQSRYSRSSAAQNQPAEPADDVAAADVARRAAADHYHPPNRAVAAAVTASPEAPADDQKHVPGAAPAMVTGIRHWSTPTYTRVAIDLGGEVEYQAARVEHPDRIFFDLHGARLASGLVGKSFAIEDDGLLKSVRAGQFGADVTRIVLDVQPVAEYSAFLLPNPTRLIIDVHGKQAPEDAAAAKGGKRAPDVDAATTAAGDGREAVDHAAPPAPAPSAPPAAPEAKDGARSEASSLPPMSVTDGSATFGLPAKRTEPVASNEPATRPRVVVSAKPTAARPVPNSVTSTVPESNREVAAVSEGPDVIAATSKPTSRPVAERSSSSRHTRHADREAAHDAGEPVSPPPPTAEGESTLMRELGLKIGRIVIDAGHGGHDSGTLGADGIEEKNVVLDVALRLGKLLHDRLGSEIVYTRADDTFIPLETRTAIANKAQADLFISVHANSSQDASARGVEVYYLNFTSDPEAMRVASRENAVSTQRVNQLSDLVKKIALKDKIDESRELAADVDTSLYAGLKKGNDGLRDRGVKKAPFVVLIGANMPSILAEISFVTNPRDAEKLNRPEYRERVAESLYKGVAAYAGAINTGARPGTRARTTEQAAR